MLSDGSWPVNGQPLFCWPKGTALHGIVPGKLANQCNNIYCGQVLSEEGNAAGAGV